MNVQWRTVLSPPNKAGAHMFPFNRLSRFMSTRVASASSDAAPTCSAYSTSSPSGRSKKRTKTSRAGPEAKDAYSTTCFVCKETCSTKACSTCEVSYLHKQCFQTLLLKDFANCPYCQREFSMDNAVELDSLDQTVIDESEALRQAEFNKKYDEFSAWSTRVAPAFGIIFRDHYYHIKSADEFDLSFEAMVISITSSSGQYMDDLREHLGRDHNAVCVENDISFMNSTVSDISSWSGVAYVFQERVKDKIQHMIDNGK